MVAPREWLSHGTAESDGPLVLPTAERHATPAPTDDALASAEDGIREAVVTWLRSTEASRGSEGYASIEDVFSSCGEVHKQCSESFGALVSALRSAPFDGPLEFDEAGMCVRFQQLEVRIRVAALAFLASAVSTSVSLIDVLRSEAMQKLIGGITDVREQVNTLRDAVNNSVYLEVAGSRMQYRKAPPAAAGPAVACAAAPGHQPGACEVAFLALPGISHAMVHMNGNGKQIHDGSFKGAFKKKPSRREQICSFLEKILDDPPASLAKCIQPGGAVLIHDLFGAVPSFGEVSYWNPAMVFAAVQTMDYHGLSVDVKNMTARLVSLPERFSRLAEKVLATEQVGAGVEVGFLARGREMQTLWRRASGLAGATFEEYEAQLCEALGASDYVEVFEDPNGAKMVRLRDLEAIVRSVAEEFLQEEHKAIVRMSELGEVALAWIADAEGPLMQGLWRRAGVTSFESKMDLLRSAMMKSTKFSLDAPGVSVRPTSAKATLWSASTPTPQKRSRLFQIPTDKDARHLRDLLSHYLDYFNMQQIPLLMLLLRSQKHLCCGARVGGARGQAKATRPKLKFSDVARLPRIDNLLRGYTKEAQSCLLAVALNGQGELPFRMCKADASPLGPRGRWAMQVPWLEFTQKPNLRFVETTKQCPETEPFMIECSNATSLSAFPSSAVVVLSYSVSSDLSHRQSPRAEHVMQDLFLGGLDRDALSWSVRRKKIERQVLVYHPDVVCIQGLQSIGHLERCSEDDPAWFLLDDEPTTNHLVHLYRRLSKENYGVVFVPTLPIPGSVVLCLGVAIFWRRSRYDMQEWWAIRSSAACVQLSPKTPGHGSNIVVCTSKPAGVYVRDWGEEISDESIAEEVGVIYQDLVSPLPRRNAELLFCGDFGCGAPVLLPCLNKHASVLNREPIRNAAWEVIQDHPWTSASPGNAGQAVDLILHDGRLEAVAAMGPLADRASLVDLMKTGNPSDHLHQLVVFHDGAAKTQRK